jgi:Flp pilus assembly protein TadD
MSNSDEAVSQLKGLTESDPSDREAWTALGDTYREGEHYAEAADAYTHAIDATPTPTKKDWTLYYVRGISYERTKKWDLAEADLQTALKLSPDEPQVLNYLGYSWVEQGKNTNEALAMLEKARKLRPFDGYIVDSVGWAYYRLGRYEEAARALEDAILLVPADPTINDHLGDAYWHTGRKIEARFQWNHALAFGPEEKDKTVIEGKLKTGLQPGDKPT